MQVSPLPLTAPQTPLSPPLGIPQSSCALPARAHTVSFTSACSFFSRLFLSPIILFLFRASQYCLCLRITLVMFVIRTFDSQGWGHRHIP